MGFWCQSIKSYGFDFSVRLEIGPYILRLSLCDWNQLLTSKSLQSKEGFDFGIYQWNKSSVSHHSSIVNVWE